MHQPFLERLVDRPHRKADTIAWVLLFVLTVVVVGFLDVVVVRLLDPEARILNSGQIIAWSVTAFVFALLVATLIIYSQLLHRALTRERSNESSRRASNEKYRELFNEAMELVFIFTTDGGIIDINPAGVRMLGYATIDALMQVNFETGIALNRSDASAFFNEVDQYGFVQDYELALKKRDGEELRVAVNARAVRDGFGKVEAYRGVMRDITDQKYLGQLMMTGQRMVSIAQLAKGLAHQFNNVITTIQGYAALVVDELPPGSSAAGNLHQIIAAAERAERLTHELLIFSRQQPLNPKPQDINTLVLSSQDLIQYMAGDEIILNTELFEETILAEVDASSMESALLSLILFSRERIRGKGEIRLSSGKSRIDSDDYLREHPEARAGDFITLEVEDSGPMIGPAEVKRIFQPFTGTPVESDSGLEMSLVYGIVVNHDGWIDVRSTTASTTFTIYLPAIKATIYSVDVGVESNEDLRGNGQRVLLVEDEDSVRTMAEMMLASNGYVVFSAHDANEAFRIFVREKGEIDAVFADVIMPGESGVSLASHLVEHKAGLPVILTSGHETNLDDWRMIQEHGYHFLPKPYRLNELLAEINSVFNGN